MMPENIFGYLIAAMLAMRPPVEHPWKKALVASVP